MSVSAATLLAAPAAPYAAAPLAGAPEGSAFESALAASAAIGAASQPGAAAPGANPLASRTAVKSKPVLAGETAQAGSETQPSAPPAAPKNEDGSSIVAPVPVEAVADLGSDEANAPTTAESDASLTLTAPMQPPPPPTLKGEGSADAKLEAAGPFGESLGVTPQAVSQGGRLSIAHAGAEATATVDQASPSEGSPAKPDAAAPGEIISVVGKLHAAPTPPTAPLLASSAVELQATPAGMDAPPPEPAPNAATVQQMPAAARANLDTVAQLSAEIARKLDARVTRFEVELAPHGLGEVSVAIEIDADGGVAAHLGFEWPDSAVELRARADELRQALQDAGFSLGGQSLSFGEGRRGARAEPVTWATGPRLSDAAEPLPVQTRRATRAGVDLRI